MRRQERVEKLRKWREGREEHKVIEEKNGTGKSLSKARKLSLTFTQAGDRARMEYDGSGRVIYG